VDADNMQNVAGSTEVAGGKWNVSRPTVGANNGATNANTGAPVVVQADANGANTSVLNKLSVDVQGRWQGTGAAPNPLPTPLLPTGNDDANTIDEPLKYLLDDTATEVGRLIGVDNGNGQNGQQCRNTVVILVTGGGEGTTAGNPDPTVTAAAYTTNWASRHVPIYVVAIAPPAADRAQLQNIASKSGGMYFEVTKQEIDAALNSLNPTMWAATVTGAPTGTVVIPEAVRAMNLAIQAAFENYADLNTASLNMWQAGAGVPATAGTFTMTTPQII